MYACCEHISLPRPSHILWSNQQWLISSSSGPAAATTVIPIHLCLQELWKQSTSPPMAPRTGNISPELWLHQQHLLSSLFAVVLFKHVIIRVLSNVQSLSWMCEYLKKGGCSQPVVGYSYRIHGGESKLLASLSHLMRDSTWEVHVCITVNLGFSWDATMPWPFSILRICSHQNFPNVHQGITSRCLMWVFFFSTWQVWVSAAVFTLCWFWLSPKPFTIISIHCFTQIENVCTPSSVHGIYTTFCLPSHSAML